MVVGHNYNDIIIIIIIKLYISKVVRQIHTDANNILMTIGPAEGFTTYYPLFTVTVDTSSCGHFQSLRVEKTC